MLKNLQSTTTLHNGVQMPWFGLGTYKTEEGEEVIQAVKAAIHHGYRSIDTAAIYENERGVGQAIQQCMKDNVVQREQLFVTTKVWNTDLGYEETLKAFEESIQKLALDYIDLYLIHWPVTNRYQDAWRALEKLYADGRVRAIGVSNFHVHHLENLLESATIVPMVNQIEYHPRLIQPEVSSFCKAHNIQMEAWSPLMKGQILDHPTILELAQKHEKTAAQIVLRWNLQKGVVTIPKSTKEHRIIENASIFDFELEQAEVTTIDGLNLNSRIGTNPDTF